MSNEEQLTRERKEYYAKHSKCPNPDCGHRYGIKKNIKPIRYSKSAEGFTDNISEAFCSACHWKGKVKDLI